MKKAVIVGVVGLLIIGAFTLIRMIPEGDIVDLVKEGKIEVRAEGAGIYTVDVNIRAFVKYPLIVRIPIGTFFESNTAVQNMVATAETRIWLSSSLLIPAEWKSVVVRAACANRTRPIPEKHSFFTVQHSAIQQELAQLLPALERAGADLETRQAAVWIVTDNANYNDLGILLRTPSWLPAAFLDTKQAEGYRVIREGHVAYALKIFDEAGIDVSRYAIWQDRQRIHGALQSGDVKTWLEWKAWPYEQR
jgi:hypothetical protein